MSAEHREQRLSACPSRSLCRWNASAPAAGQSRSSPPQRCSTAWVSPLAERPRLLGIPEHTVSSSGCGAMVVSLNTAQIAHRPASVERQSTAAGGNVSSLKLGKHLRGDALLGCPDGHIMGCLCIQQPQERSQSTKEVKLQLCQVIAVGCHHAGCCCCTANEHTSLQSKGLAGLTPFQNLISCKAHAMTAMQG